MTFFMTFSVMIFVTFSKCIESRPRSLFQMSVKTGKKLDLHESSSDDVPWYANGATGKHSLGWAVPSLCKLAGVPVLHNRYKTERIDSLIQNKESM